MTLTSPESNIDRGTADALCPELLAPAGDWECAKAAVENGADAIYFGLDRFNARMRAHNFTEADLPKLMEFLHRRGVKGYVTFNTLVFANELSDAQEYLRSIISAGVDAAIVQDVGICRLIRKLSPDFPIHGSTQMTVTSAAGLEFARELGCNLVVLARECSLAEIEKIRGSGPATEAAATASLPLEVFVHGALCVAYSGQCLTSESLGGRSANRGECAQACRMPYELVSDGQTVPLGDKRYLLSPQDLAGLEVLPDLIKSGVASLKIEGRLKTPEYVANITRVYRSALDKAWKELNDPKPKIETAESKLDWAARYDLEMGFSRGLYTGWFRGIDNQKLAHARFGKKRGVYLGEVARVERDRVLLKLEAPLKQGDGVVFDAGRPDQKEEGGRVYLLDQRQGLASLAFGAEAVDFTRIHKGDKLWKTSDPELDRRLRQTFSGDTPKFQRPLNFEVHGALGTVLTVTARDELANVASAQSTMPLAAAEKHPLTEERLREQLGRLGGTPFALGRLVNQIEGDVVLPISELNKVRRELVSQIEAQRSMPKRWQLSESSCDSAIQLAKVTENALDKKDSAELVVLVRGLPQLHAALECGSKTIYCEFEDPKKYREAVSTVRIATNCTDRAVEIWVAPPRIFKTGEEWILKIVRSSDADGYLVRNYDHLKYFRDCRKVGDFSLNIANQLSAEYFRNQFQLERLTASYDLNAVQLEALLGAAPASWFEITLHQHMPMFHMEHCVFCAFLSKGTDYRNCGRPCDTHEVKLRDRVGAEHPLKADAGCRNTVFNSRAQTGAEYFDRFYALGTRHFRIEFLNESPEIVRQTISHYRKLLRREISGSDLWRELNLQNQLGVTRGQIGQEEKHFSARS
ncbi:MAG: yhbU [Verrucomicrobiales bacterium]|nr:yhbU [Verrucomicrobiales bacterium]